MTIGSLRLQLPINSPFFYKNFLDETSNEVTKLKIKIHGCKDSRYKHENPSNTRCGVHIFTLFTFLFLLNDPLRIKKNSCTTKVRYTTQLLGARITVLRNQLSTAEQIFRETCLLSACLVV